MSELPDSITFPLEATVTDLDGVIRTFPEKRDRAIESRFGLPPKTLSHIAFQSSSVELAITGIISDSAWRRDIITRLKTIYPDIDCEGAVKAWSDFSGIIDYEVLNELLKLKERGPLILVTNATNRLDQDLNEHRIVRHFDRIINSSAVGFAKPSFEIYKLVLFQIKKEAKNVLWIDDTLQNIRTARGLGFRTHHYESLPKLKEVVQEELYPLL